MLTILNLSNLPQIQIVNQIKLEEGIHVRNGLDVHGNRMAVTMADRVDLYDLTDPIRPSWKLATYYDAADIHVSRPYVGISDQFIIQAGGTDLIVYENNGSELTVFSQPAVIIELPGEIKTNPIVFNHFLYVTVWDTNQENILIVYDLNNLNAIQIVGSIDEVESFGRSQLRWGDGVIFEEHLIISCGDGRTCVFDVGDKPKQPEFVEYLSGGYCSDYAAVGQAVYSICEKPLDDLWIERFEFIEGHAVSERMADLKYGYDIDVMEDYLIALGHDVGALIFKNESFWEFDESKEIVESNIVLPIEENEDYEPKILAHYENYIYARLGLKLAIYDASDPENIKKVNELPLHENIVLMKISGHGPL